VLSLTGYKTPDPLDLLYQPRGVSLRLASNLIAIAPQVLEQEGTSIKGEQEPGGGGGLAGGDILRSRFAATAFFLGAVETDSSGDATVVAKLPDNLTTFRVMAVAVTAGDRYGHGESPLLVTRPLLVRFVSVIGTATSFYLLLSAVPLYARSAGASTGLAGLTTTALTLSSVAAYPVTPRLMARYGTRAVLAGGLLALGLPALALAVTANIGLILAACVVRGAGFAVLCVAGGALTVSLIPAHRRGEGLALVGLM